jgi:hypothetical protein
MEDCMIEEPDYGWYPGCEDEEEPDFVLIKLTQWCVLVGGKEQGMFTPPDCDPDVAMAIAVATFGEGVTSLVDEGVITERKAA